MVKLLLATPQSGSLQTGLTILAEKDAGEKIILTGGSAFLTNLVSYFSKATGLKTLIGDPWSKIIYPLELKPVLEELGPKLGVAIGLAVREIV